ncbi:MAG: hypothetical protein HDR18_11205 [Lachnospiraceae bacterium]|nr:hypothetical protein [Lachnospiraceae bacterium]
MSSREEKAENLRRELLDLQNYNRPTICRECGGVMVYKGCGEFRCEDCNYQEYDDYGKVRNYIEKHAGATAAQASDATGVSQKAIRDMLKEERLEIAPNSNVFLTCEICGSAIRFGKYCAKCETAYHRAIEEKTRASRNINLSGFSAERPKGEEGSKRFTREQ